MSSPTRRLSRSERKDGLGQSFLNGDSGPPHEPVLAQVWKHANFQGNTLKMSAPETGKATFNYDDLSGKGLHDEISSIRVQPGVKVSLFKHVEGGEPQPAKWDVIAEGGIKEIANFKNSRIPNDEISAITVERLSPTAGGGNGDGSNGGGGNGSGGNGSGGNGSGGSGNGTSAPQSPSQGLVVTGLNQQGILVRTPGAFAVGTAFPSGSNVALATPQGGVAQFTVQSVQPAGSGKTLIATQPPPGQAANSAIQSNAAVRLFPNQQGGGGGGGQIIRGVPNTALAVGGVAVVGSMLFVVASQ